MSQAEYCEKHDRVFDANAEGDNGQCPQCASTPDAPAKGREASPAQAPREWWITKLKPSGMISAVSEEKPSDWILGKHAEFEVIWVREVLNGETKESP